MNIRHLTEAPEFDTETASKDQNIAVALTETVLTLADEYHPPQQLPTKVILSLLIQLKLIHLLKRLSILFFRFQIFNIKKNLFQRHNKSIKTTKI
jgi:hypothetical protein